MLVMTAAVGLELEGHQFRAVLQRKRLLFLSLAGQTVLLPAIGFGLTHVLALPPRISAGMLLIAACPVGDIANFYTLLARANLALSVTLNALTILIAPATMAFVFETYDHLIGVPFEFRASHPYYFSAADPDSWCCRCLPAWLSAESGRSLPPFTEEPTAHRRPRNRFPAHDDNSDAVRSAGGGVTGDSNRSGNIHRGMALAAGLGLARLLRLSKDEPVTIGIGFAVRNVALALGIAVTILNRMGSAVFAVVYFMIEVPLLLGAIGVCRRRRTPAVQPAEGGQVLKR